MRQQLEEFRAMESVDTVKLLIDQEYGCKGTDLYDNGASLRCHRILLLDLFDDLIYFLAFIDLAFLQRQDRAKDVASEVI